MAPRREALADAVRQRVMSGLSFGSLRQGQRLPSARVLAREFGADPRSVIAALRRLESEGLLIRRPPSRAYYVAAGVGRITGPGETWLTEVLLGALSRGVPAPRFADYAHRAVATLRLRALCIECNRDQQQWLCRELEESFGLDATALELGEAGDHAEELRRADLLVTTASHAKEVRDLAARVDKPWVVASLRQDLVHEIGRLLQAGPLFFVVTDPRFADKLRRDFADRPGAANLRTVVLGEDEPAAIPAGAPAYIMRTARDALGGPPPQVRALPTLRSLSAETARTILSFMVRENVRAAEAREVASISGPPRGAAA